MLRTMELLGLGKTAEVFALGDGLVCKLFYSGYPGAYVEHEFHNAKELHACGIRMPRPVQLLCIEGRPGIVYERIDGPTMLSVMRENPAKIDALLDQFVRLQRSVIARRAGSVLSYKEHLTASLQGKNATDPALLDQIAALPEGDRLLHGDFHPDNILMAADGSAVLIDFMNVCRGPALYDIARTCFLIRQAAPDLAGKYLDRMLVKESELEPYLAVIGLCRQYEG